MPVPGLDEDSAAERTVLCPSPSAGNWGPHLVVVRSCNILKWELELKRWCPGLKTLVYVGSPRELKAKRQVFQFKREINQIRNHLKLCETRFRMCLLV